METVKFFMNFVHDREFDLVLNRLLNHYETQALILEQEGKKFKIEVPKRPPYKIKTSAKVDVITDSYIFRNIYNGIVAQLFSLMTAYRSTTTNDHLRGIIKDDLIQHVKDFEILYKYGKHDYPSILPILCRGAGDVFYTPACHRELTIRQGASGGLNPYMKVLS